MLEEGEWVELAEMLDIEGRTADTGATEARMPTTGGAPAGGSAGFVMAEMEVSGRGGEIKLLTGELSADGVCEAEPEPEAEPGPEPGEAAAEMAAALDLRCISASTAADTPAFTGFMGPEPSEARTFVTPATGRPSLESVARRCWIFLNALRRSSSVLPNYTTNLAMIAANYHTEKNLSI